MSTIKRGTEGFKSALLLIIIITLAVALVPLLVNFGTAKDSQELLPKLQLPFKLSGSPSSFDWRNFNIMTPVKSQGSSGSCVAYATIGAFEADIRLGGGPICDFSEDDFFYKAGGNNENGLGLSKAFNYLKSNGVPDGTGEIRKLSSWGWVGSYSHTVQDVKSALIQYGPLVAGFTEYADFANYSSGVYHYNGSSPLVGGHSIVIVGYSDSENYWIAKNSWGPTWGENGYFRIGYGEVGIEQQVAYLVPSFPKVGISIYPIIKSGWSSGSTLTYTINVVNIENTTDNFTLTVIDNDGWSPNILPTSLLDVLPGENRTATLSVTIPSGATVGDVDSINITVTSQTDSTAHVSGTCIAQMSVVPVMGVSVAISPNSKSGLNGSTLTYTVTVRNTGNVSDTYYITSTDAASWSSRISPAYLTVAAGGSGTSTLSVTMPVGAVNGSTDTIVVTASGTGDDVSASCTATVTISRGVRVSISPSSQSGVPGATLTYTVTVSNTGSAPDNYILTFSDNAGWPLNLSPTSLAVPAGGSRNSTLNVTIPSGATLGAVASVTVTATGPQDLERAGVISSGICTVHVASGATGINVSISPSSKSGANGATLTYTVTVNNIGIVSDTYSLTATDNSDWSPIVSPNSFTVSAGGSATSTLSLTIPSDAADGTIDGITVTATGTSISSSASCTSQVTKSPSPPPPNDNTPPPTPLLVSPANGANMTDNTPTFDWSDLSDTSGVTYDISIAKDVGMASIVAQKTGLTASNYSLTSAEALVLGTYYWRVRAVDDAGNAGSWSDNWLFAVIAPPDTTSRQSVEIPLITLNGPVNITLENNPITAFDISVLRNVWNVRITVKELIGMPSEIAIPPSGTIYQYLEITKENITDNDISSVTITFRTEKGWITTHGIEENTVSLKRYNSENGEWLSLPTTEISEDLTYVYFSAISPGLSYFAVSGTAIALAPASFMVSSLNISPSQVSVGQSVSISVKVKNTGDLSGTYTVTLKINGIVEGIENVTLSGGASRLVTLTVDNKNTEGTYSVEVGGETGTFTVAKSPPFLTKWPLIVGVFVAIGIIGIAVLLLTRWH